MRRGGEGGGYAGGGACVLPGELMIRGAGGTQEKSSSDPLWKT